MKAVQDAGHKQQCAVLDSLAKGQMLVFGRCDEDARRICKDWAACVLALPQGRFGKSEMKIIWCADGFTARVSDETEGHVHFAHRETRGSEKGVFVTDLKLVSWKEVFLKILDEKDPEKLARLVPEADLAMFKRRQELSDSPQNSEELSTMSVASEALRVVKRGITKPVVLPSSRGNPARFANFVRRSRTA
jgi:hypothetical protein